MRIVDPLTIMYVHIRSNDKNNRYKIINSNLLKQQTAALVEPPTISCNNQGPLEMVKVIVHRPIKLLRPFIFQPLLANNIWSFYTQTYCNKVVGFIHHDFREKYHVGLNTLRIRGQKMMVYSS